MCVSSYLHSVLSKDGFHRTIKQTIQDLKPKSELFNTIAFRGISGALVAPVVAHALDKNLIVVRKETNSHSFYKVEGEIYGARYIVIDDFVSSGSTILAIVEDIQALADKHIDDGHMPVLVGVYCYNGTDDSHLNLKLCRPLANTPVWVSGVHVE